MTAGGSIPSGGSPDRDGAHPREVSPDARLRIAFVTAPLVPYVSGGAERRVHELATRLAARHDVHVVSWGYWGPERSVRRDGLTLHAVGRPRPFYGADGRRTIRESAEFAARLPAALARLDVDVVDVSATPYLPVYGAWLGTRWSGTPLVATWHEYWGDHWHAYLPDRPAVARLARVGESWARSLADRRVAVSRFTAHRMAGGGDGFSAVEIVGNGVDAAALARVRPDRVRSDLIFVGRLIDEKRVDLVIETVAALAGQLRALRCVIVGDGPARGPLEALARARGVADRVIFTGRVDDRRLAGLMRASRILLLPSTREGYGIAAVEAQACGLVPIVARSPLSGAPELIVDGVDGLVCDPDVGSLAAAVGDLLRDGPRHRRLARAARRSAAARDWDAQAAAMERVYLDLIGAGARRTAPAREPLAAPRW
jgi:glycosyltransferase involved in cell wall biosynthesis